MFFLFCLRHFFNIFIFSYKTSLISSFIFPIFIFLLSIHLRKTCRNLRIYLIVYFFSKILNILRIFSKIDIINIILIINIVYDHRIHKVFVRIFIFFIFFFFIIILFYFDFDKRLILSLIQINKIVIFFMNNLLLENVIWFIFGFFLFFNFF